MVVRVYSGLKKKLMLSDTCLYIYMADYILIHRLVVCIGDCLTTLNRDNFVS